MNIYNFIQTAPVTILIRCNYFPRKAFETESYSILNKTLYLEQVVLNVSKWTRGRINHMANYLIPYDCNVMEHNICEKWLSYHTTCSLNASNSCSVVMSCGVDTIYDMIKR